MCALICLQFSGETFSTIVHDGTLTVKRDGNGVSIDVSVWGTAWMPGRSFAACRKKTAQGLLVHACIHSARQLNFSNDWSNSAVASADTALCWVATPHQSNFKLPPRQLATATVQRKDATATVPNLLLLRVRVPFFQPSCLPVHVHRWPAMLWPGCPARMAAPSSASTRAPSRLPPLTSWARTTSHCPRVRPGATACLQEVCYRILVVVQGVFSCT